MGSECITATVLLSITVVSLYAREKCETPDWFDQSNSFSNRFRKNAKYALFRTLISPTKWWRIVAAIIPSAYHSLSPIWMIYTGVGHIKRGIGWYRGKPSDVTIPLGNWHGCSPKPPWAKAQELKNYIRYAAAMQWTRLGSSQNDNLNDKLDKGLELNDSQGWDFIRINPNNSENHVINRLMANLSEKFKAGFNDNGRFIDERTGNVIDLFYDTKRKEIIISHGGTFAGSDDEGRDFSATSRSQIIGNISNMLGSVPPSVEQSIVFSQAMRKAAKVVDLKVVDVGNSRGGLNAQAAALANNGMAVCVNAAPMSPAVQRRVGIYYNHYKPAGTKVIQFNCEGDWLSDHWKLRTVTKPLFHNLLGVGFHLSAGQTYRMHGHEARANQHSRPCTLMRLAIQHK